MSREQIATLAVMNVFLLPGIFFGAVLCRGKGADLIAGYNTASAGERARWDEKALCRSTGVLLLGLLALTELVLLGCVLGVTALIWTGMGLLAVATAGGILYINKSNRFCRK